MGSGLRWKENAARRNYYGLATRPGPMNRRIAPLQIGTRCVRLQESTDPLYKPFRFSWDFARAWPTACSSTTLTAAVSISGKSLRTIFPSRGGRRTELLFHRGAGTEKNHRAVHRAHGTCAAAALDARLPAVPLQLLSRSPRSGDRPALARKKIPADTIYLDIDYQEATPRLPQRQYFPTFEKMVADLREQGFHVIAITDLHIKRFPDHGYAPFDRE